MYKQLLTHVITIKKKKLRSTSYSALDILSSSLDYELTRQEPSGQCPAKYSLWCLCDHFHCSWSNNYEHNANGAADNTDIVCRHKEKSYHSVISVLKCHQEAPTPTWVKCGASLGRENGTKISTDVSRLLGQNTWSKSLSIKVGVKSDSQITLAARQLPKSHLSTQPLIWFGKTPTAVLAFVSRFAFYNLCSRVQHCHRVRRVHAQFFYLIGDMHIVRIMTKNANYWLGKRI